MTKEHEKMVEQSLKQRRREEQVEETKAAIIAGVATWFVWFLIFFA